MDAQSQDDKKWETFRQQIKDDISQIQMDSSDDRVSKDYLAFNYWILANMYDEDEQASFDQITEYGDKGIDCFVHREESKELFIIQNKYYEDNSKLDRKEIGDFLLSPLANLEKGDYKRSKELQNAFNKARKDSEYTIYLHFYVTSNNLGEGCDTVIKHAKMNPPKIKLDILDNDEPEVKFELFRLHDIYNLYYGRSFDKKVKLTHTLTTKDKSTHLHIDPTYAELNHMPKTFFVMTPVTDVYDLYKKADDSEYPLFERNIREYLGKRTSVNKEVIRTLKDGDEKEKFFYYNNGITIICDGVERSPKDPSRIEIKQPQVINGCQTVNSIFEVLDADDQREKNFAKVHIMAKIFETDNSEFANKVVQSTNSQNAINERVMAFSRKKNLITIQKKIREKGFLLVVKQSDKNKFKDDYKKRTDLNDHINLAKKTLEGIDFKLNSLTGTQIELEKLLQSLGAFEKDAYFAYAKKAQILNPSKPGSTDSIYEQFTVTIEERFTTEDMVKIICLYKKSEQDRRQSEKKRFPLAYYLLNFFGYLLKRYSSDGLKRLRNLKMSEIQALYDFVKPLSEAYYDELMEGGEIDYAKMPKRKIDEKIFPKVVKNGLKSLKNYRRDKYEEIKHILDKIET